MKRFFILLLLAALPAVTMSQTFTITGSSASFYNSGTFCIRNDDGKFRTDNGSVGRIDNSNGVIQFEGLNNRFTDINDDETSVDALTTSDANRLTGQLNFERNGANGVATSQNDMYLTNLSVSSAAGNTVRYGNAVFVSGTYTVPGDATRDYATNSNSFIYDGSVSTQPIVGEADYYGLYFQNGARKILESGQSAVATNEVGMEATATDGVTINGSLDAQNNFYINDSGAEFLVQSLGTDDAVLQLGDGTTNIDGELAIEETGAGTAVVNVGTAVATVNANGSVLVTSGTFNAIDGDLTLAGGGSSFTVEPTGNIVVGDNRIYTINDGGFVNNEATVANRNNMDFSDNSTVLYNGGNVVMTNEDFGYGNLTVNGVNGVELDDETIFVDNVLDVQGNDFDISSGVGTSSTITLTNVNVDPVYEAGLEVVGRMDRVVTGAPGALVYNNAETTIDFTNGGQGTNTTIGLDVRPSDGDNTTNAEISDFDDSRDIDRSIRPYFSGNGATFNLVYAYQEDETDEAFNQNTLRYREDDGAGNSNKVSTGEAYTRNVADAAPDFRTIALNGLLQDGDGTGVTGLLAEVSNGGVLFLRGGPAIFISVNSGRWSNPDTWDEGEQPGPEDMAVVRHTVHAGYERQNDNFTTDENVHLTTNFATNASTALVGKIIVDEDYGGIAPTGIASLLLGTTDGITEWALNPDDTAMENNGWGTGEFANAGGLELEPTNSAYTALERNEANSGGTLNDVNNGLVVFAGATLIIDGNATANNNAVNNVGGKILINEDN